MTKSTLSRRRGATGRLAAWLCLIGLALSAPAVGAPVRVVTLGVEGELRDNVRALLGIAHLDKKATEAEVRRAHSRASEEIARALSPFGYYRTEVIGELSWTGGRWDARYQIDPGEPVRIRNLDLRLNGEGKDTPEFQNLVAKFPLQPGDPLDHRKYERGKKALTDLALEQGFLDAEFDSTRVWVDPEAGHADIVLHFDTGPRFFFGPVTLNQSIVDEGLLIASVPFEPGDPLSRSKLTKMQSELSTGPYFRMVEVQLRRDLEEDRRVPIDVDFIPARIHRYEIGAGYGTDTKFRVKLTGEIRRLNRKGHHLAGEIRYSQLESSLSLKYKIPRVRPRSQMITLFAGVGIFDPNWSFSTRRVLGIDRSQNRWGWRQVFTLAYEAEDFEISTQTGESRLLTLGTGWTRIRADNKFRATRGVRLAVTLKGGHDALLSTTTFLHTLADFKGIQSLSDRFRLIGRAQFGHVFNKRFTDLPPTLRFVTGGDLTVRGFGYETLGPRDENGNVVGGESLITVSMEVEYQLLGSWALAAFIDTGNGINDFTDPLETGAGAGVRWISPVGMFRVDGAWALSTPGAPWRVHLSIGPDF